MWKLLPTILLLLIVAYTDVQAETTSVTTVTCVDTSNSPETGDITTVCTTTVVTTVTTPESTTTTTSIAQNLTSSGDILDNSQFVNPEENNNNYSDEGWTITNGGSHNSASGTGAASPNVGGVVASGNTTNISQTVTSIKSKTGMSDAEIKNGFRSTLSAKLWFWNNATNTITLKQTITDSDGNTTTQTRVLIDTGCGYSNCGQWEDFDDTYIQGNNTATDFSIKAEVSNTTEGQSGYGGHVGPDIDDIELNIQHNEITTTTETVAATSSSSTATTSATTISYCWQQTPSTCADDQPGIDDIEEEGCRRN